MVDSGEETVPCHYCGADVDVPAERSRFEAFTTHFETEHIRKEAASRSGARHQGGDLTADVSDTGN